MKYQDSVLPLLTSTIDFKIYHCDRNGRPDMRYRPDSPTSVCVRHICNLARSMVKTAKGWQGFMKLATQYGQERPNAWFLQSPGTKEDNTEDAVKYFWGLFDDDFNGILVSDAERNPENIASHFRRRWDGQFKLSEQYIFLNGVRLNHMLGTAIGVKSDQGIDDLVSKDYRAFVFSIASGVFHEMGHVLITYLSGGEAVTPPKINARVVAHLAPSEGRRGESGHSLEDMVFGGVVTVLRDPIGGSRDNECGVPFLINDDGTWRITQKTIDRTVALDFEFPYEVSNVDESKLRFETMGMDQPDDAFKNPLDHPDWPKIRDTQFPDH